MARAYTRKEITFDEIFPAPPSLEIIPVWKFIKQIYRLTLLCVYGLLSVVVGPFLAFGWAFVFAVYSFVHIWWFNPGYRFLVILFTVLRSGAYIAAQTFIEPLAYAMGSYFSRVHVKHQAVQKELETV